MIETVSQRQANDKDDRIRPPSHTTDTEQPMAKPMGQEFTLVPCKEPNQCKCEECPLSV